MQCRTEDGRAIAVVRYPPGTRQPPHTHEATTMSLVLRGALEERVGASSVDARVCDVVVKPLGTKHENAYLAADTTLVQVTLPAATIRHALDAGCSVDRWSWRSGTPSARALATLARLISKNANDRLDGVVDEALAALGAETKPRPRGPVPAWLGRVRDALDEAYEDGGCVPKIAELARDAGVHRVHLSREFLRYFGASPTEYRQQARLRVAARRLSSPAGSLSGAAYRSGFADQAHMTREFRRWLGVTPLEYRRLVPAAGGSGQCTSAARPVAGTRPRGVCSRPRAGRGTLSSGRGAVR